MGFCPQSFVFAMGGSPVARHVVAEKKKEGGKIFIVAARRLRKKCGALYPPIVFGFVFSFLVFA